MKVTIEPIFHDWNKVKDLALFTQGKSRVNDVSSEWKRKAMLSEHSMIRILQFEITAEVENFVSNHIVRHHQGVEKFVQSLREDITGIPNAQINRNTPTNIKLILNAQALVNISRKRLCNKASTETITFWRVVFNRMIDLDECIAYAMVPECIYRGFCTELKRCGYDKSKVFEDNLKFYREI